MDTSAQVKIFFRFGACRELLVVYVVNMKPLRKRENL